MKHDMEYVKSGNSPISWVGCPKYWIGHIRLLLALPRRSCWLLTSNDIYPFDKCDWTVVNCSIKRLYNHFILKNIVSLIIIYSNVMTIFPATAPQKEELEISCVSDLNRFPIGKFTIWAIYSAYVIFGAPFSKPQKWWGFLKCLSPSYHPS